MLLVNWEYPRGNVDPTMIYMHVHRIAGNFVGANVLKIFVQLSIVT